jgi:protein-S-isoprenylcysteine O-methyltransferase Ste14
LDFLALLAFLITFTIAAIKIHERTLAERLG